MARPLHELSLDAGKVYRTASLRPFGDNPSRLSQRLEASGRLRRIGRGLFYAPKTSRYGEVPPSDGALLDAFFDGSPYLITGPPRWNALGLGSTALFVLPLIYNKRRAGHIRIGHRLFDLRKEAFPTEPRAEWFVIDLLRHADEAGVDRADLQAKLTGALRRARFDRDLLEEMARTYGRRREQALVRAAAEAATR